MKLPTETLLDSFRCLDRCSLDAIQFSSKRFRNAVDKLSGVCLRYLKSASIRSVRESEHHATISCSVTGVRYAYCYAHMHLEGSERSCMIRVTPKHGWQTRKWFATREDVGECFAMLIAASFVERIVIEWVQLTDGRLQALQPVLPTVHVGRLLILNIHSRLVCPNVFVETVTSFGSIRDLLRSHGACNGEPIHIDDVLLAYAAEQGTRVVDVSEAEGVTEEGILNFLKTPSRTPETRKLELCRPRLTPHFMERLLEAHDSGLIDSNVVMNLWQVKVPRPDVNGPLRFSAADFVHGYYQWHRWKWETVGGEIKLVATFSGPSFSGRSWRQSIHYVGLEATHQDVLQADLH